MINSDIWKKKAIAFVTRSHRHLWGKNNEEALAFLFLKGLENQLTKDMVLGWNKFGQKRLKEKWGIKKKTSTNAKFLLTSGIVIPYIIDKELTSVFIVSLKDANKAIMVPGSQTRTLIFSDKDNDKPQSILIVQNIMDGLYLYQETKKTVPIIICPDINGDFDIDKTNENILDEQTQKLLFSANNIQYFYSINDIPDDHKKVLGKFFNVSYHSYNSKEELIEKVFRSGTI